MTPRPNCPAPNCETCGIAMPRRRTPSGTLEGVRWFLKRRFCSQRCSDVARFSDRYEVTPSGCWEWTRGMHSKGYGLFSIGKRRLGAHRAAWLLFRGSLPAGLFVCHRCDNPPCCNPDHLFLGTAADNTADMVAKGRSCAQPHPCPHCGVEIPTTRQKVCDGCRALARETGRRIAAEQLAAASRLRPRSKLYPFAPVEARLGRINECALARDVGCERNSVRRWRRDGLSATAARRVAEGLKIDVHDLWPEWAPTDVPSQWTDPSCRQTAS